MESTSARRTILAGAGLAAGATLLPGVAEAATSTSYRAGRHHGAPLLSNQARHLVGRFAYGVTPSLAKQVDHHGGARRWFEWQLSPDDIGDHDTGGIVTWFPGLG